MTQNTPVDSKTFNCSNAGLNAKPPLSLASGASLACSRSLQTSSLLRGEELSQSFPKTPGRQGAKCEELGGTMSCMKD